MTGQNVSVVAHLPGARSRKLVGKVLLQGKAGDGQVIGLKNVKRSA